MRDLVIDKTMTRYSQMQLKELGRLHAESAKLDQTQQLVIKMKPVQSELDETKNDHEQQIVSQIAKRSKELAVKLKKVVEDQMDRKMQVLNQPKLLHLV